MVLSPLQLLRTVLALFTLLVIDVFGGPAVVDAQPCRASAADLQALRDNLEIVRNQVRAARNETGTEKQWPAEAVEAAIRALAQAAGHTIPPSPDSGTTYTPRGGAAHPHVQFARQAFGAAQRAFDDARCALPGPVEPLQKAMADLDRALQFR
jgi:hypothetical protein